jgi:nicotinamidase/pyrazinamidase
MRLDPTADILGLVDIQPTFMPGGELPVADGQSVVPVANRLLALFPHAFATQDWHPAAHTSFANAELHRDLVQTRIEVIVRKGFDPALDSYSTFFENDHVTATGLDGWLRQRGFRRLFLAGLATDFCVAWSAEDAARLGYEVLVIEDACRGIALPTTAGRTMHTGASRTTMDEARDRLKNLGVGFLTSADLGA